MVGYWPLVGFQISDGMGYVRLGALCATFSIAVLHGEFFRTAMILLGVVCFSAAVLSKIDRSTGLIGRYVLFGISVFAIGFAIVRGGAWAAARLRSAARTEETGLARK